MIGEIQKLLENLVAYESITPKDHGCQEYMISYLEKIGFKCTRMDKPPVSNFFASIGNKSPLVVFAGHTDVVAPGDESLWDSAPFTVEDRSGYLYGRGVADMKGSLAAMLVALKSFLADNRDFNGSLGFLITSGEEGDHFHLGTPHVMEQLKRKNIKIDYCILGEPSSHKTVGDVIKIGRRGSLTCQAKIYGIQGHVAYPHLAQNPIHEVLPALSYLTNKEYDNGNEFFPPTSLQITNINSGVAGNVIPGELNLQFNFRYSPMQTKEQLQTLVSAAFTKHQIKHELNWRLNGEPFITKKGKLIDAVQKVISNKTKINPELSTSGGTSDGRFIAPYGIDLIELGPVNESIHKVNERIKKTDLYTLYDLYKNILTELLKS